MSHKI